MHTMDTRGHRFVSCLLLSAMLAACVPVAASKQLQLGRCIINVRTHELRQHCSKLRQSMVTEDSQMGLKLLKSHTMENVQPQESCCFLRMLLRFYVERVFNSDTAGQSHVRRSTSNLANSFLSITKDLRQCHAHLQCHCHETAMIKFAAILAGFEQLTQTEGSVKALGELDALLDWLDGFQPS